MSFISSIFSTVFMKVLSFISAFLMLFLSPGGQIRQPSDAKDCPSFYGETATANPLDPTVVPQHPYLAPEGKNGMHSNSYNTGTYDYMGPLASIPLSRAVQ